MVYPVLVAGIARELSAAVVHAVVLRSFLLPVVKNDKEVCVIV